MARPPSFFSLQSPAPHPQAPSSLPMPSSPPITFSPPDSQVPVILRGLASPSLSLAEVAAQHNTSTEALSLWMLTPAIREQLESTDSISTWRTRLIAKSQLSKAIGACTEILAEFHADRVVSRTAASLSSSHPPSDIPLATSPDSLRASVVRVRACECARKSAAFIFQLSRLSETPGPRLQREQSPARSETLTAAPRPQVAPRTTPLPAPTRPTSIATPLPDTPTTDALVSSLLSQPPSTPLFPTSSRRPIPSIFPRKPPSPNLTPISTFLSSVGSPISQSQSEPGRIRPEPPPPP